MSNVQLSLFDGAPEDIDQTIFATPGTELGEVTRMAQKLTHGAKRWEGRGGMGRGGIMDKLDHIAHRRIRVYGWSGRMVLEKGVVEAIYRFVHVCEC